MIEARDTKQHSFLGSYVYDKVVPRNHLLRAIDEMVDFSFVTELAEEAYCPDNGRPGWSPLLMFKMVFLQFLYDLSDYRIADELTDRLSFKMFVGLDVEETPPDHSSISRFRDRLGAERFMEIFNRIVEAARARGLVSDKLHIIDATDVNAKVDLYRIKREYKDKEPETYIDNHSPIRMPVREESTKASAFTAIRLMSLWMPKAKLSLMSMPLRLMRKRRIYLCLYRSLFHRQRC
jgi:transposase